MSKVLEKIKEGRQYRSMTLTSSTDESESYIVKGYATTFNQKYELYSDEYMKIEEQIDSRAFEECDMSDVIFQYDHSGRVYARNSNNTLKVSTDSHGLYIEADLGGTENGRNLHEEISKGYTTKMSFGFKVEADEYEEKRDENGFYTYVRTIKKISKLYDVSAVSLPANDATEISARAFCDGVIAKAEAERLQIAERNKKIEALRLKMKLMEEN